MKILKLKPSFKDYIWGGDKLKTDFNKSYNGQRLAETWELSAHKDGASIIENGEYKGKSFREYLAKEGKKVLGENAKRFDDFPILIKFIDAKEHLSIQVHPDNDYALANENQYGKTEVWYVVDCEEGAYLYYGFAKEITALEFEQRIKDNTLLEVLNKVYVKKGDVFFIEAGTIHAICKDILIAEIQQNSNVTYRVYDYGRTDEKGNSRELHVNKALDVTKRTKPVYRENSKHIAKCDYFTVDKLTSVSNATKNEEKIIAVDEKSFLSVLFLDGEGTISVDSDSYGDTLHFKKGDSFFIPAHKGNVVIKGKCEALLTKVDEKSDEDNNNGNNKHKIIVDLQKDIKVLVKLQESTVDLTEDLKSHLEDENINWDNLQKYLCKDNFINQTKNAMMRHQQSYMWTVCDGNLNNADEKTAILSVEKEYDTVAKNLLDKYNEKLHIIKKGIKNIIGVDGVNYIEIKF